MPLSTLRLRLATARRVTPRSSTHLTWLLKAPMQLMKLWCCERWLWSHQKSIVYYDIYAPRYQSDKGHERGIGLQGIFKISLDKGRSLLNDRFHKAVFSSELHATHLITKHDDATPEQCSVAVWMRVTSIIVITVTIIIIIIIIIMMETEQTEMQWNNFFLLGGVLAVTCGYNFKTLQTASPSSCIASAVLGSWVQEHA